MGDASHEPSMGEILSSIKRIIAEDADAQLSSQRGVRRAVGPVADPAPAASRREAVEPPTGILELTSAQAMTQEDDQAMPVSDQASASDTTPIVSPDTAAATRSSIAALSRMVVKPEVQGADTLEGMVRDMLKPMLADWLDANLPMIVERLVGQEIKRIAAEG